jgi:hypothetical protein
MNFTKLTKNKDSEVNFSEFISNPETLRITCKETISKSAILSLYTNIISHYVSFVEFYPIGMKLEDEKSNKTKIY